MGFGHEHEPIRGGDGALAAIDPAWYYRRGAGPLPDVTVYSLQLLTSVLGPVRRVTALANTLAPQRTWRDTTITIEIPDNNVVLMEVARRHGRTAPPCRRDHRARAQSSADRSNTNAHQYVLTELRAS